MERDLQAELEKANNYAMELEDEIDRLHSELNILQEQLNNRRC